MRKFTVIRNNEAYDVREHIAAVREYIGEMSPQELEAFGHDDFSGPDQMNAALDTIDVLAAYDTGAAWKQYIAFMEANLSGMSIQFHDAVDDERPMLR